MHLLREGQFAVASTFLDEAHDNPPQPNIAFGNPYPGAGDEAELTSIRSQDLQVKFSNMYRILHELKNKNLSLAIEWARQNSKELEARGSNLEFELHKLLPDDEHNSLSGAIEYAREYFPRFRARFLREIKQLSASMAYVSNLRESPYGRTFETEMAWNDAAVSFSREFCFLLGLSAESPLYIAVTAGAIALPTLLKLASIMKEKRTEWTTQNELPVEIPLPRSMTFHAIFVCPVSKEQTTETNPPMMMPCGHVIAKESLQRLSKGQRFKCPYCPSESWPKDSREIYL
jgi:E3 ubiquitin-protein transferase RMND5